MERTRSTALAENDNNKIPTPSVSSPARAGIWFYPRVGCNMYGNNTSRVGNNRKKIGNNKILLKLNLFDIINNHKKL
jgi:hypothetical protein